MLEGAIVRGCACLNEMRMTSRGERLVRDLALLRCLGMDLQDNRALALLDIGMFTDLARISW